MRTEIETVTSFFDALEDLDIERALTHVAPEITYRNVPFPPARGLRAFGSQMGLLRTAFTGFEVRMHNIASNGPVVLTERTDVLVRGSWRAAFWVCGTFEVVDGRIVTWRDYFDFADVSVAMLRGFGGVARARLPVPSRSWKKLSPTSN